MSSLSIRDMFVSGTRMDVSTKRLPDIFLRLCMWCMVGLLCACTKMVVLQSNLSDADANEMVYVLTQQGIESEKQKAKEGVNLLVKDTDISRATAALTAAGLPRRGLSNLGEVFKKQGMISTPLEERIRYLHGLSEELEYTLQQFDNVISARVHVVLPERIAPGEPIQPSSAAVLIKYRAPFDEDIAGPRIRKLIASSIPGLSSEEGRNKVSVVMTQSEMPASTIQWTSIGPFQVQADSAGTLIFTLVVLSLLAIAGFGLGGFMLAKNHPKFAAMLKKKGAAKENETAAPEGETAPAAH